VATINYTSDVNAASGAVKVTWSGMAGGDVGQVFDCAGLKLGSVQYFGTFNSNTITFKASNEVSASTYAEINNRSAAGLEDPVINGFSALVGAVRPEVSGSGGNVTVAALFVKA
jgi:hypothetical protein